MSFFSSSIGLTSLFAEDSGASAKVKGQEDNSEKKAIFEGEFSKQTPEEELIQIQADKKKHQATQAKRDIQQSKDEARLEEIERHLRAKLPRKILRLEMKRLVDLKLEQAFNASQKKLLENEIADLAKRTEKLRIQIQTAKEKERAKLEEEQRSDAKAAQKVLDEVKEAEERAIGEMKLLLVQERKLAETLVLLTSELKTKEKKQVEVDEEENRKLHTKAQSFTKKIKAISSDLRPREKVDRVDPLWWDLVHERRKARVILKEYLPIFDQARENYDRAEEKFASLRDALPPEDKDLQLSDLDEKNRTLQSMNVEIAKLENELSTSRYKSSKKRKEALSTYKDGIQFNINKTRPFISNKARSRYLDVQITENWTDALAGVEDGVDRILFRTLRKFTEIETIWGSLFELAWWIAKLIGLIIIVALGLRLFMPAVPRMTKWITRKLFTQNFFARRPRLAIKLTEVLRVVIRPLVWYAAVFFLFDFVSKTLHEMVVLVWVIDAVFLYAILIRMIEVLVLPRWYRKQIGSASVDDDDADSEDSADLMGKEVKRAKKLVWSAKILITFLVVAIYVPNFIELVIGFSVISFIARFVVWSFFLFLFFLVVSRWKTELADIFLRVASDRLQPAAEFVQAKKDKWYGVFVIGFASIYVAFFEAKKWISTYIIATDIFTKTNNFLFRKKIEMQSKSREQGEEEEREDGEHLPESFCDLFQNRPLELPSQLYVENEERTQKIFQQYEKWKTKHRQGSVAIIGEQGIGKTTLLRRIRLHFLSSECKIVFETIHEKRRKRKDVLDYIRRLFELPKSKNADDFEALIEAVKACEPRVIILDDCHHFFMRQIGGFDGLDALLTFVNLTDESHFYVLAFNKFTWAYVNRVRPRNHYFGNVVDFVPWSVSEIQEIIERRCAETQFLPSFNELIVTHEATDSTDYYVEVVKTANGYFRYLQEFSGGNLAVVMCYWLRSLRNEDFQLSVSLFSRPKLWSAMADENWFVLTAIAQHGTLSAKEVAQVANLEEGFCALAINYFVEKQIAVLCEDETRATLTPLFFRQVLKHLDNSNYLYA